jgi:hypothetical protein
MLNPTIRHTEARMERDLGSYLVLKGLARFELEETPLVVYLQHRVRLTLYALTPHAKVQR